MVLLVTLSVDFVTRTVLVFVSGMFLVMVLVQGMVFTFSVVHGLTTVDGTYTVTCLVVATNMSVVCLDVFDLNALTVGGVSS